MWRGGLCGRIPRTSLSSHGSPTLPRLPPRMVKRCAARRRDVVIQRSRRRQAADRRGRGRVEQRPTTAVPKRRASRDGDSKGSETCSRLRRGSWECGSSVRADRHRPCLPEVDLVGVSPSHRRRLGRTVTRSNVPSTGHDLGADQQRQLGRSRDNAERRGRRYDRNGGRSPAARPALRGQPNQGGG